MSTRSRLTVYFEPPFWVGVYERESDGKYEAGKLVFGAEPKDFEVLELVLDHWKRIKLSPPVDIEQKPERRPNPKRMQREISASLSRSGAGTKAQEALKLQYEQNKAERRAASKERRELEKERRFEQRREKKKEKHRGH